MDLLPKSIKDLRVIIGSKFDLCPCAGTCSNLSEIGDITIVSKKSKVRALKG